MPFLDNKWITELNTHYNFDDVTGNALLNNLIERYYRKIYCTGIKWALVYTWHPGSSLPENLFHQVLIDEGIANTGWFNNEYLQKIKKEHQPDHAGSLSPNLVSGYI